MKKFIHIKKISIFILVVFTLTYLGATFFIKAENDTLWEIKDENEPMWQLMEEEYIRLVNKDNLLDSKYKPKDLVKITVRKTSSTPIEMRKIVAEALKEMFDDAKEEGINLYAHSGFRSYGTQKTMYDRRLKNNKGRDDGVVAFPGASDHQTGLGIDVISKAWIGKRFNKDFGKTKEAIWMAENSWKYGFIIRYPAGKEEITQIIYEPWHLRYVGMEAARYITENEIVLEEFFPIWEEKVADTSLGHEQINIAEGEGAGDTETLEESENQEDSGEISWIGG